MRVRGKTDAKISDILRQSISVNQNLFHAINHIFQYNDSDHCGACMTAPELRYGMT